jgi:methyl-accepting chemotaxis protein
VRGSLSRFARALRRPASWQIAAKMMLAMVATALLPMMITAYYNVENTQEYVASVERRNLEQLAQSTAGRIAQLLADGKVIGAVVLRIKAEPIGGILEAARKGDDRTPFLIDGDGVIVWHPDERVMFSSLMPIPPAKLAEIVADQRFRRRSIDSLGQAKLASVMIGAQAPGNVTYFSKTANREEIAGFAPLPGHDWVVGVSESREYFAAPIDRLFRNVLWSVALVGALFVLIAALFARSIVRPIKRLTSGAHALKGGDFDHAHIEVRSNDELGQLARTFNVMIDVLRQRERERSGRRAVALGYEKDRK